MIYKIENNIIKVFDKNQFNPKHILECGQIFRFGKDENNNYYVISLDQKATIIEKDDCYEIISKNPDYFVGFFDLNTDYNKIKTILRKNKILRPMIDDGYGIRILKSDPVEMIFSFVISQNNNIKRIQNIIEKLCTLGELKNNFHAFPSLASLNKSPLEFYESLGAGYRAKFLKELSTTLKNVDISQLKKLSTDDLFKYLVSLKGIGPKVASCILLFGFGRSEKFPVDTWIEQVYYNHFSSTKKSRQEIQRYFENEFGQYSGIAQQYLFYYEREK